MPTPQDYVLRCNRINAELAKHDAAGVPLTKHLVAAGDEAVNALKELLEDKAFWAHLNSKKAPEDKSADPYAPVVTQYHAAVLTALGYQPPPPAQQLAQDVADAITNKRGATPLEVDQVRQRIAALKDSTVALVDQATKKLSKKGTTLDKPTISERLKRVVKATNEVVLTVAALVGMFYGPLFPPPPPPLPPAPPPVVIVVPAPQLPPGLQTPPPGAEDRGLDYFFRALPPPDGPPGPPSTPRKT